MVVEAASCVVVGRVHGVDVIAVVHIVTNKQQQITNIKKSTQSFMLRLSVKKTIRSHPCRDL